MLFFFKQKTAYEMRISDWSSDVCSSDLISPNLVRAVLASEDTRFCEHSGFDWKAMRMALAQNLEGGQTLGASTITMQTAKNLFLWPSRTYKIGRASCRERVCQYV